MKRPKRPARQPTEDALIDRVVLIAEDLFAVYATDPTYAMGRRQ